MLITPLATTLLNLLDGIFAFGPSTRAGLGNLARLVFPTHTPPSRSCSCVVGHFTGFVRPPLSAIVIVSEVTPRHRLLMPLSASGVIVD